MTQAKEEYEDGIENSIEAKKHYFPEEDHEEDWDQSNDPGPIQAYYSKAVIILEIIKEMKRIEIA